MHAQLISALISVVFAADTGRQLAARWARPPVEASTAPLYVWNGEMSETAIDRYLTANAAQGVQAAFIHPRPGLITPYLSGRWFSLVRHTVAQGKQRGMHVWLYDENSYPSGFAGGHVPAEMPESWNQGAGLRMKKLATLDPQEERRFVHVIRGAGGVYAFEPVFYEKRAWHGGYSYVDLLKPGVTEKFIELTMGGYEAAIGHEFGHTVPGIFTDEPNIFPPSRDSMRWTPDLFARFEKLKGYDLRPYLTALWEETGDWRKVRHDYWSVLLALFLERWSKPWFQYTEKKGLIWTGHYWEHEWPNPHHVPDNMAVYAWHQMPGIDLLFNQWREDTHAQFGNVRSVREVASVAHQLGRRRVFCETYGGGGWELRFEDMKRLGDWMFGLGINFLNQHLAFHTIAGARKHDYPQSFSYHEPWWDHYRKVADYQARLSLALSSGEVRNRILVIEPTTSAWMYASLPGSGHPRLAEIGREFQDFLNSMEAAQVEYDLASEDILRRYGKVSGSRLMVGHRAYDVLVLPPGLESLEQPTAELLERYRGSGGELAGFVDAVERVDGVASARLAGLKWRRLRSVNEGVFREPDFSLSPRGKVFHQRRRLGDGQLVFLVNSSLEERATATLRAKARFADRLDAERGVVEGYAVARQGEWIEARIELPPAASLLLFLGEQGGGSGVPLPPPAGETLVAPSTALEARRTSPNALTLDYCDTTVAGKTETGLYYYPAAEKIYQAFAFAGNPWNTAVQYKTSIVDRDRFAADTGFTAAFSFNVAPGVDRRSLKAVVERPRIFRVRANGAGVEPQPGEWWLDRDFALYEIGSHIREARNTIEVEARPMSVHAELEPVYVLGEFSLESHSSGWRMMPARPLSLGSWKQQGAPFYSHTVSYARTYRLSKDGSRYLVRLGRWHGTVAEVRVNGSSAGVLGWQPYEIDITPQVRDGGNKVEVLVTGSLKNLLGPHHGKVQRGLVSPGHYRSAPETMPPGTQYDLADYGLLEEFAVVRQPPRR